VGNINISRFCVEHDIRYWCGLPGDEEARYEADRILADQIEKAVGYRAVGVLVMAGVRVGGGEDWPTSWRWGFGRNK